MNIYIIYQIFIVDLQNEKYLSSVHSTIFCAKLLFPPLFPLYFNIYKYIPLSQNYVHESIKIKKKIQYFCFEMHLYCFRFHKHNHSKQHEKYPDGMFEKLGQVSRVLPNEDKLQI